MELTLGILPLNFSGGHMFLQERLETLEALLKAAAFRNFQMAGNYKVGP